jgi:hypothetical protein
MLPRIGEPGPAGSAGVKGDIPAHQWNGTQVRFQNADGSWGDYVDLKGADGERGLTGLTGQTGQTGQTGATGAAPEHSWSGTQLRFKNPNGEWGDYVDLKGSKGDQGEPGQDSEVPGPQGPAGPNQVNTTTATNITGILKGSSSLVAAATADTDYLASPASAEQGDIIYAGAGPATARLAHGTSGQLLKSGGHAANPSWGLTITVASSAPQNPATGDIWIDTT